jgi:hypothetical protein
MLSRQQMENVINGGGSVLHKGRLITRIENLPSAMALAKTPEEKEAAKADLQARMEKLQAEAAELEKSDSDAGDEKSEKAQAKDSAKKEESADKKDAKK